MRRVILTAAAGLMMAASFARADGVPQIIGSDPLSEQILAQTDKPGEGLTAAMRGASGRVIVLRLGDAPSTAAALAPAAKSPEQGLAPAAAARRKPARRAQRRRRAMPRRAIRQLKRAAARRAPRW